MTEFCRLSGVADWPLHDPSRTAATGTVRLGISSQQLRNAAESHSRGTSHHGIYTLDEQYTLEKLKI